MCGRYRRTTSEEEIARQYHFPIPPQLDLPISYNIAPTENVLAIRRNPETGERTLDALRWGLIPNWAKDEKIAYKTINARVETVDTAPSYREAFKKRRCLIPADGFYEWRKVLGGKIPYHVQMKDNRPFVFAGLWEGWKPHGAEDWIRTYTIITGEPNELVREIHTRMPVILPEDKLDAWLSGEAGKEILVPYPADEMTVWPTSPRVNTPKDDDPGILEPIVADVRRSDAGLADGHVVPVRINLFSCFRDLVFQCHFTCLVG
jgi:putative SOS response-associated peptidase YedK